MSKALKGKVALVTGASRGIGAAIAKRLADDGAEVIVHYGSSGDEARSVVSEIEKHGGRAHLAQADLADEDGADRLLANISNPSIDILVNNAGVVAFTSIQDTDAGSFDRLANVNMRSLFFVTKGVLPRMPNGGRVINLSSVVSRTYFAGLPAYAATKRDSSTH